jgi:hypothetical protein
MDSWQLDDLPIGKFSVVTTPNLVTGEIRVVTKMMGQVKEQIIQTTDDQIRNALIDMKWIPPNESDCLCDDSMGWITVCGRCGGRVD